MTLTAAQHAVRKIGSSDAAVALGIDPWREPFGWWLERTGREERAEESIPMAVGTYMEPWVRGYFADHFANLVGHAAVIGGPVEIPECDWADFATANLDGTVCDDAGTVPLEIKTASAFTADKWGESGTDEVPANYVAQVMHQIAVTGAPHAYVAALIGNSDFRWYRIERSEALIDLLRDAEARLWQHVVDDMPPTPESLEGCAKRWPEHDEGKVYDMTEQDWQTLLAVQAAGERKRAAEAEEKAGKLAIAQSVEDAELLIYGSERVATYRADKRGRRALRIRKGL